MLVMRKQGRRKGPRGYARYEIRGGKEEDEGD